MNLKCEEYNQICVMSLTGEFVGETALAARKHLEEYIDRNQIIDFVVDFEKSGFIDSDGLDTLLWMKRRCEDMFGKFKLANLDENCRKILELTRLEHRLEHHPDLATALKTMR